VVTTSPARQVIAATMVAQAMQTNWMAAPAHVRKVGVAQAATPMSPARQAIAATMAAQPMSTNWMAAPAHARRVGQVQAATPMSPARLKRIAVLMAQPKTRIQPMVAIVSVILDGKVMPVRPR